MIRRRTAPTHKICRSCNTNKPRSEFYPYPRSTDGLASYCKTCSLQKARIYDKTDIGRKRNSARTAKRLQTDKGQKQWAACQIVRFALRLGCLQRTTCSVCGSERVEAHHEDYMKPLEVQWLCKKHHVAADIERRAREASTAGNTGFFCNEV